MQSNLYSSPVIIIEMFSMPCEYFIKQTLSYLVENTLFPWGQNIRVIWFCEEETPRTWAFAKNKDSFNSSWSSSKAACLIIAFCIILSCLSLTYNFTDKKEFFYTCIWHGLVLSLMHLTHFWHIKHLSFNLYFSGTKLFVTCHDWEIYTQIHLY